MIIFRIQILKTIFMKLNKKMTPKELVKKWVEIFNNHSAEEIAQLYHDDAINHQVTNEPIEGRDPIKQMFADEFAKADMTCIIENIFEDGEWAILERKDPLGLLGCGFFHIIDGKIKFQRGYWDRLSFLRMHNLPLPD